MSEKRFDPLGLIKEILVLLAVTGIVYAWTMLVLLIISFVALSYITLKFDTMLIVSAVVTTVFDIAFMIGRIKRGKVKH